MKIIAYIKSLFTDIPQPFGDMAWYYRRGKKISEFQLFLEIEEAKTARFKDQVENGFNIKA